MKKFRSALRKNGEKYMKKPKNITVKTGTVNEFMERVRSVMSAADRNEPIKPSYTVMFEDPAEMLHFLSDKKIKLIDAIRKHPGSVTQIAKTIKRNRAAVYRDIQAMELFGLVKTSEEVNPGHGRHKIVQAAASAFKLEAYI